MLSKVSPAASAAMTIGTKAIQRAIDNNASEEDCQALLDQSSEAAIRCMEDEQ
jgi:hypothetical protein